MNKCSIEWTTTPPTEPGKYWYRDLPNNFEPEILLLDTGTWLAYGFGPVPPMDVIQMPGEWWPERIKEPVEKGQATDG